MVSVASKLRSRLDRFLYRHMFSQVKNIFTHLTEEEKIALHKLSRKHLTGNAVGVEIGSYCGASSVCIASGMGAQCRLFCVDTWNNDAMSEGARDTFSTFISNSSPFPGIIPLRGRSTEVVEDFSEAVHFLFLDGDHSYEGIKADIDAWWPKLRSGGIIVMHDIGWAEGVQQIAHEFVMPSSRNHGRLPNLFWATKVS